MGGTGAGIVVGLVGPVCAGKSEVARLLRQRGAEILDADAIVRELYDSPEVQEEVRRLFGDEVFDAHGQVDRAAIASRIFGPNRDPRKRQELTERIIFPRTGRIVQAHLATFRARAGPADVLVLDAPTLIEAGRKGWCDKILFVTAPVERRNGWAVRRGWDPGEVERRDAAMIPEPRKRLEADLVIENSGDLGKLERSVQEVWDALAVEGRGGLP